MFDQKIYPTLQPQDKLPSYRDASFFHKFLNCDFDFKAFDHFKKYDCVLILGTGGSSLGGQTLDCLSDHASIPELIFIDNIDPVSFDEIMNTFDPETTAVIAISKSGETAETLMQTFTLASLWKKSHLARHFGVITENKSSPLFEFAKNNSIPMIFHPQDVGGRYSIFTCVGMLIAKMLGFSPQRIHAGAHNYLRDGMSLAIEGVSFFNAHSDKSQLVMMPYSDKLTIFTSWFRQLWAESLGKKGRGITPICAQGTVDQHSQLQLYLEGPQDKMFTFIQLPQYSMGVVIKEDTAPAFLKGKTLGDLFWAEENATIETLKNKGIPVRVLEVSDLREENIGALFMHFIVETVFMADQWGIDPFDQPAVEEGKLLAKNALLRG